MSLDSETGMDPSGIRVRPVTGLVTADYFAAGYFVWAVLIANLARIGYEEKNMYMASYDWRLSFQNTEVRDQTLSRIKNNIELMVATSGGKKAVIIPHSMGVLYFLHFMKWVEAPGPMGDGGGSDWSAKHIKAVMNIGGPFLGVPKSVPGLFSAEVRDISCQVDVNTKVANFKMPVTGCVSQLKLDAMNGIGAAHNYYNVAVAAFFVLGGFVSLLLFSMLYRYNQSYL